MCPWPWGTSTTAGFSAISCSSFQQAAHQQVLGLSKAENHAWKLVRGFIRVPRYIRIFVGMQRESWLGAEYAWVPPREAYRGGLGSHRDRSLSRVRGPRFAFFSMVGRSQSRHSGWRPPDSRHRASRDIRRLWDSSGVSHAGQQHIAGVDEASAAAAARAFPSFRRPPAEPRRPPPSPAGPRPQRTFPDWQARNNPARREYRRLES